MNKDSFNFWKNWLLTVNLIAVCIGVLIAFAGNSFLFAPHNEGTKALFFSGDDIPADMLRTFGGREA